MADDNSKTAIRGSCNCGAYKFKVQISENWRPVKCNCAICSKKGALWVYPKAAEDVIIEQDDGKLVSYIFDSKIWSHQFCGNCGVNVRVAAVEGGWPLAVNARTFRDIDITTKDPVLNDGRSCGVRYEPNQFKGQLATGCEEGTEFYKGSCHCGTVAYAARTAPLDKVRRVESRGNLSAYGAISVPAQKEGGFRGEISSKLGVYEVGSGGETVKFCLKCGITIVVLGSEGIPNDHLLINFRTLDVEGWEEKLQNGIVRVT